MEWEHVFNLNRWRARFRSEASVRDDSVTAGRTPDATVDDVGASQIGADSFDGKPLPEASRGNGQGSGDPFSGGWAGRG